MSLRYSQKIKLIALFIFLAMFVALPAAAIQILHAGVKINKIALATESYLITRDELNDFLKAKEDLKAANATMLADEALIKGYKAATEILIASLTKATDKMLTFADKLEKAANDKDELIKNNAKLARKAHRNNLLSTLLLGIGMGIKF